MSSPADLLGQIMLQHRPKRCGLMLKPGQSKKYDDRRGTITPQMLAQHLDGTITLAAPAVANDLAAVLPIDVDRGGIVAICALLDAAHARGLKAWAEFHPRDGWADDEQRGYVWIAFDRLVPAAQLQLLGRQLIAAAQLTNDVRQHIECRAHQAITRLPFAKHTHTGRFGALLMDQGHTWIEISDDPHAAYERWASADHHNSASLLPELAPLPVFQPQRPSTPGGVSKYSPADLKRHFNQAHDVRDILQAAGARQHTDTLYRCPCGQHRNGDANPSLLIKQSRRDEYGTYIAQGATPSCAFWSGERQVWDAFNVYMRLHGLSFTEMLIHVRQTMNLHDTPTWQIDTRAASRASERPRSANTTGKGGMAPPTAAGVATNAQTQPAWPAAEAPAAAQGIRDGMVLWLAQARVSPAARTIALYLIDQAASHQASWCKRTLASITTATGCARRTAQRALRQLQLAGAIQIQDCENKWGADQANIYRLTPTPGQPALASQAADLVHGRPPCNTKDPHHNEQTGGGRPSLSPMLINRLVRGGDREPVQLDDAAAGDQAEPVAPSQFQPKEPLPAVANDHQAENAPPSKPVLEPEEAPAGEGAAFTPVPEGMYLREDGSLVACGVPSWSEQNPKEIYVRQRLRAMKLAAEANPPPPAPEPARRLAMAQQTSLNLGLRPRGRPQAGAQALQAELARIEREARRCFAVGAPQSGRRYQAQARELRERLAEQGYVVPLEPKHRRTRRVSQTSLGV